MTAHILQRLLHMLNFKHRDNSTIISTHESKPKGLWRTKVKRLSKMLSNTAQTEENQDVFPLTFSLLYKCYLQ